MPIPIDIEAKNRELRELRLLEDEKQNRRNDLRRMATRVKLLLEIGDDDSKEKAWELVAEMERRGMAAGSIRKGPSALQQVSAMLSRPNPMLAYVAHLLEAADIADGLGDEQDAAKLRAIAQKYDGNQSAEEIARWREATRPVKEVRRPI